MDASPKPLRTNSFEVRLTLSLTSPRSSSFLREAQLGAAYAAFANLARAQEVRDPALVTTKVDPLLDPIRKDPRYAALIPRLALA